MIVILIVFLFVAGCGSQDIPLEDGESVEEPIGTSDKEILQQFPDELDEALEELDQVE